ncbi:MAG: DUF1028 domain-containing protein, partial [Acidobacteriota bacterium]
PKEALDRLVAADPDRERRQVGVIGIDGRSAQWTGKGQYGAESRGDWVAERSGATFAVQGNSLVSPDVVSVVAETFQASEGSARTLADRLIEALHAGQKLGGDGRHGETPGFRTIEQFVGRDVLQLKILLHSLGFYRASDADVDVKSSQAMVYTQDVVEAVDRFRSAQGWQTTVPGYVDARTIASDRSPSSSVT